MTSSSYTRFSPSWPASRHRVRRQPANGSSEHGSSENGMDQEQISELRVSSFKGPQNLPLYVAMRQGYFAARGLAVELIYTTGSAAQLAGLVRGEYQLVQTAPDNVINLDTHPAAFEVDADAGSHVVMVLGGSIGPLGVYARRGVPDAQALRGAAL